MLSRDKIVAITKAWMGGEESAFDAAAKLQSYVVNYKHGHRAMDAEVIAEAEERLQDIGTGHSEDDESDLDEARGALLGVAE